MSQTETRPGFRLPWTAERNDAEATHAPTDESSAVPTPEPTAEPTIEPMAETTGLGGATPAEELVTPDLTEATAVGAARRPTKFMADLSRAMQTAAEASRDETMARFAADAKGAVEEIRTGSAEEAAALRRRADDDVAAVREWSKAEIARIREETDARIVARKAALDGEMDAFAAVVEARVDRVNRAVTEFEAEMADFFERLLAEQDPTRIATMAQAMPDPPDLSALAATVTEAPLTHPEPVAEVVPASETAQVEVDAATEPAVEPPADAEAMAEPVIEMPADGTIETTGEYVAAAEVSQPDFAAAEAEAAASSGDLDPDDGLARLSGDPEDASATAATLAAEAESRVNTERLTTRVVVHGLVSVASIATFKRSLGRVSGVTAIGVASGPDGEFVFTVSHDSALGLPGAITALPGFEARITAETPGGLEVAAHDPDAAD